MRRLNLFSVVLSLFLLVPASITWAQTVTLTGVVYEPHTIKIPFNTPDGRITIKLPDVIRPGETISGTVSMEPEGKNEKTRNEHLARLNKHQLSFSDGPPAKIEIITSGNRHIVIDGEGIPIRDEKGSCDLILKNPEGIVISKAEVPIVHTYVSGQGSGDPQPKEEVSFWARVNNPSLELEKRAVLTDEPLVIFSNPFSREIHSGNPSIDFRWYLRNGKTDNELYPVCGSSCETVLTIPKGVFGPQTLLAKDKSDRIIYADNFNVIDIRASLVKPKLMRGERTTLSVEVVGLAGCPYPLQTTIVNQSIGTINLDKGNNQTHCYDPSSKVASLNINQGVTGVSTGDYNISANLILPAIAFGDIFQQQKSALKTSADYNAWVDAIKKDLRAYAGKQGNDEIGRAAKTNARRAIDNIPNCSDNSKLDECKAFADAYLRPVDIPRGAATMWVCSFEAYKAAIKAIASTIFGNPQLIDWEVIKNGCEFVRQMGEQLKDEGLSKEAGDAKKIVEGIQRAGETKENLEDLKPKLDALNGKMNGKISLNEDQLRNYKLQDLLVSGYINNLAPVFPTGFAGPPMVPLSLSADSNSTDEITFDNYGRDERKSQEFKDVNPATYHVLLTNMLGVTLAKEGATTTDSEFSNYWDEEVRIIRARNFKNPFVSELSFPEMDSREKDKAAPINVKLMPDHNVTKPSTENPKSVMPAAGKNWMPTNFKVSMGDLPCEKISNINSFKITSKISREYPVISFRVPGSDISPWQDWYKNYDLKKELKNGAIEYFDQSNHSLFSLALEKTIPIKIEPSANGFFSVSVKPGALDFDYNPLPPFLFDIRASNYVANEIAGTGCNPEGATTYTWLYIEKPCRVEMKTTRAENVSPDSEEFLDEIADLLGEISEEGTKMGGRLAKTFSITKSFSIWIEVVRDWESYKAEYVCKNGVWQHGTMTLVNKGTKQVSYWEKLTDESGQSAWTKDDDMGWIKRKAEALKDKVCK